MTWTNYLLIISVHPKLSFAFLCFPLCIGFMHSFSSFFILFFLHLLLATFCIPTHFARNFSFYITFSLTQFSFYPFWFWSSVLHHQHQHHSQAQSMRKSKKNFWKMNLLKMIQMIFPQHKTSSSWLDIIWLVFFVFLKWIFLQFWKISFTENNCSNVIQLMVYYYPYLWGKNQLKNTIFELNKLQHSYQFGQVNLV